jgi:hypothetical protein
VSPARPYDFPYEPVPASAGDDDGVGLDLLVATSGPIEPGALAAALAEACGVTSARTVLAHAPLFWTQVHTERACRRVEAERALRKAGVALRYVASARRQSLVVPPSLDFGGTPGLRATDWAVMAPREQPAERGSEGRWFLRDEGGGLAVDRALCGMGSGMRLAVIDEDAADLDLVTLDATVLVGIDRAPRASGHGALVIGWAVGARTHEGPTFSGVAPDASVRAYLIPRPGDDVVSLPLALVRAAVGGADVIVCATYLEGVTTPMLDDAFELVTRLGRGGLGCIVVLPTSRETSSPRGSIHASLSLSLSDPASDPRVLCVGPGGRRGGWFLWREQHGRLRPFANRGPAVRCLAPGDDLAYPFLATERLFHAESSGASALAAGVALLVVSCNPWLRSDEVLSLLARTASPADPLPHDAMAALADKADALPAARDADGHDAKHGYGRIHALAACLAASDPVALELVAMGETGAARAWLEARHRDVDAAGAYSGSLACWAVKALLGDHALEHALRVVLRHVRLLAADRRRADAHPSGGVSRQIALLLRTLDRGGLAATDAQRRELRALAETARRAADEAAWESRLLDLAETIFARPPAAAPSEEMPAEHPNIQ